MKVLSPSPALIALNQALSAKPVKYLTREAARAQMAEHLAEAQLEFRSNTKVAFIARH